jgi:hypothetical protein
MLLLSIAVLDPDRVYMEKLAEAIRRQEGSSRFYVRLFSYPESLDAVQPDRSGPEILLIDSRLQLSPVTANRFPLVIVLTEQPEPESSVPFPSLFKYQPVTALLSSIEQLYRDQAGKSIPSQGGLKIWTVFSMTGGSGKTTFALQLARVLAHRHRRTFYWPADWGASIGGDALNKSPEGWANTFYYVKSGAKQLPSHWLEPLRQDPESLIFFKESSMSWRDWLELTPPEISCFLELMRGQAAFDDMVCDGGSNLELKTFALMQNSDRILWLLNDQPEALAKARYAIEQLRKEASEEHSGYRLDPGRITFIVNKYSGRSSEELRKFPERIGGFLPSLQELNGSSFRGQDCLSIPYEESMKRLIDQLER